MKTIAVRLALLALLAGPAAAGDCLAGSSCANHCPLAKQANARMSDGREGFRASPSVRHEVTRRVLLNMEAL